MDAHSARPQRVCQQVDHGEGPTHQPKPKASHVCHLLDGDGRAAVITKSQKPFNGLPEQLVVEEAEGLLQQHRDDDAEDEQPIKILSVPFSHGFFKNLFLLI